MAWVSYKSVNYNYYSSKAQVRGSCNFGARVIGLDAVFNPLVNSLPVSLSYMGSVRPLKPQVKAFPIFFFGGGEELLSPDNWLWSNLKHASSNSPN